MRRAQLLFLGGLFAAALILGFACSQSDVPSDQVLTLDRKITSFDRLRQLASVVVDARDSGDALPPVTGRTLVVWCLVSQVGIDRMVERGLVPGEILFSAAEQHSAPAGWDRYRALEGVDPEGWRCEGLTSFAGIGLTDAVTQAQLRRGERVPLVADASYDGVLLVVYSDMEHEELLWDGTDEQLEALGLGCLSME